LRRLVSALIATVSEGFRFARFRESESVIAHSGNGLEAGRECGRFVVGAGAVNAIRALGPQEPSR